MPRGAKSQSAQRELEFRVGVGERWGVSSHKEQEKQEGQELESGREMLV